MRIARAGRPAPTLTLLLMLALAACSTPVPPTVTIPPVGGLDGDAAFWVVANREAPRVIQSLENAGLKVATDIGEAKYALEARIGRSRGFSSCGDTRNVIYIVTTGEARVLGLKARGRTGTCEPNILDEMSQAVASYR